MNNKNKGIVAIAIILLVLIIDQCSKIWVKTNMSLYESIEVFSWFKIYFVENPGMAFGIEFGGESSKHIGKLFLTLFRIIAIGFIAYYLHKLVKANKHSLGLIACIALIWAGAFGNIIDSVLYGEMFSASHQGHVASLVSWGEGYGNILHGKVVDMLYFPMIETVLPEWIPFWGGENFVFFSPIFNIADSAITIGIFILLLFYRQELWKALEENKKSEKSNL